MVHLSHCLFSFAPSIMTIIDAYGSFVPCTLPLHMVVMFVFEKDFIGLRCNLQVGTMYVE